MSEKTSKSKSKSKAVKIGVVVGRFQSHSVTAGQRHLLESVLKVNDWLVVFVGTTAAILDPRDPLGYEARRLSLLRALEGQWEGHSQVMVQPLPDMPTDLMWGLNLDRQIEAIVEHPGFGSGEFEAYVTLYGSRDSFLPHYQGRFRTEVVPELPGCCATDARKPFQGGYVEAIGQLGYLVGSE